LTSAGRIDATVDGRPLHILGDGADIRVRVPSLAAALALRGHPADTIRIIDAVLESVGGRLRVKLPVLPGVTVSPRRGAIARLLTLRA